MNKSETKQNTTYTANNKNKRNSNTTYDKRRESDGNKQNKKQAKAHTKTQQ